MPLIKVGAIDSTNNFLKKLATEYPVENFTTVCADAQFAGKGQRGATWDSEPGKNLMMSMFIANKVRESLQLFTLNFAVALAVSDVLIENNLPDISVKWPNDIMSGDKKIGGILIENILGTDKIRSIIGIGINMNQTEFFNLPRATSLAIITGKMWERDSLLDQTIAQLKVRIALLSENPDKIASEYNSRLFKRNQFCNFTANDTVFEGTIVKVSNDGLLHIAHANGEIKTYEVKEIAMIY